MIISAHLIRRPRAVRHCTSHVCASGHEIEGPAVRLYGRGETSDPPFVIWICPRAAAASIDTIGKLSDKDEADVVRLAQEGGAN